MTNSHTLTLRSLDIPRIVKFGIGFDSMFDELMRISTQQAETNYPPYNVLKYDEDHYAIELAVAGFLEGEINVTVEKNQLIIEGSQANNFDQEVEYRYRGISSRDFVRSFPLAEHVRVLGAEMSNGILTVRLEREVPEEHKPKRIAISYNK
jgi:molecular chaperone IbpA